MGITMDYSKMKVTILGSTGSVGTQAVFVARELGVDVTLLAAGRNVNLLAEQAELLKPSLLSVADSESAEKLRQLTGGKYDIIYGADALEAAVSATDDDVVIHSVAGLEGTRYALAAAKRGVRLAMANKEAIIAAGELINESLKASGGVMIPVDSEHSAIFQCLAAGGGRAEPESVKRILLTASGGPFFGMSYDEMRSVTPEKALSHPTWKMGQKITVDSATLMNKGFEVMEAVRLFGVSPNKVEVLVHRQSIIHSMVEYIDNSVIAQLAAPDMRSCIRYALTYPSRAEATYGQLDFAALGSLTFAAPDCEAFPLLSLAYEAIKTDGTAPASLISADEAAVAAFLNRKIGFGDIYPVVKGTLDKINVRTVRSPDDVYEAVTEASRIAEELIGAYRG